MTDSGPSTISTELCFILGWDRLGYGVVIVGRWYYKFILCYYWDLGGNASLSYEYCGGSLNLDKGYGMDVCIPSSEYMANGC